MADDFRFTYISPGLQRLLDLMDQHDTATAIEQFNAEQPRGACPNIMAKLKEIAESNDA